MPARRPYPNTGRKRRQPSLAKDEKAALNKEAKQLAKEMNAEIDALKAEVKRDPRVARDRAKLRERRIRARRGTPEKKRCKGINLAGKPCKLYTLLPDRWDGDEEITGDYCLWHEPTITQDQRDSFHNFGSSKRKTYRKVTPGEMAHILIQRSPQHFLRPYLKALGLRLTDDGEVEEIGSGLKLHGYSRGGEVHRSAYPDYVGQVNIAEKLLDRVYGKARQSVDLASQSTTVNLTINMDVERVGKVAQVLAQAGALPNGNGHKELPEIIEGQVVDDEE